ncbi:myo-inositol oxygenase [Mycena galericulata]|nr:myo-inositol oxygenase [Mycena galericulata]
MRIHDDLDTVSDAVDEVNILKGKVWAESSQFDATTGQNAVPPVRSGLRRVKSFYKEQHGIWEAMEKHNALVDDSDPDTDLSQIEHLYGKPDWMQVTGLVHDLGKLLHLFGSEYGQRDVVGDTFVVGCAFSEKIVLPDSFAGNPDSQDAVYSTEYGIYKPNCGLTNVMLSWGHDEHPEGAYTHLTNASDEKSLAAVRAFNPYDLYSKSDEAVDPAALKPYYEGLIKKYFNEIIEW